MQCFLHTACERVPPPKDTPFDIPCALNVHARSARENTAVALWRTQYLPSGLAEAQDATRLIASKRKQGRSSVSSNVVTLNGTQSEGLSKHKHEAGHVHVLTRRYDIVLQKVKTNEAW